MTAAAVPLDERGRIGSPAIIRALTFGTLLDALAVRVDGPRAAQTEIRLNFDLTDVGERWLLRLEHGAGKLAIEGDGLKVVELFGLLDQGVADFAIVTP